MAKSLVLGNGNLLVCLDRFGQVKDFYYPHLGPEHHVGGHLVHKIGVHADNRISWLSDADWQVSVLGEADTMCSKVSAVNANLGLSLSFSDVVYNETDVFIRSVTVENFRNESRQVRIFFNQQFQIAESYRGDTGYFRADVHAVIHYKGKRVFLISGQSNGNFFDDYSIGLLGIEGREGTWRDAEDGVLSKNPIEHGSTDSVLGFTLALSAKGTAPLSYWIAAGRSFEEANTIHRDILSRGPRDVEKSARDYWNAWVNKREFNFHKLSPEAVALFKKSLYVIRAHCENNGGIIASGDSDILQHGRDTYGYVWPRDGAYISLALCKAGYFDVAERFFEFCRKIITPEGYLLHKYLSDGSVGSSWHPWVNGDVPQLPIQEDETAVVLASLWEYYEYTKNIEFIETLYNPLIKRAADFLARYRDRESGLPRASFDLWEEKHGVFCYTASSVYGGLVAARKFAELLGKSVAARRYEAAAETLQTSIVARFINEEGYFRKSLIQDYKTGEYTPDDTVDISSVYGIFRFNVLPASDRRLGIAFRKTIERLETPTNVGGIARYVDDTYFTVDRGLAGNPWIFTTLWAAEYTIARAKNEDDLAGALEIIEWAAGKASASGMLPEQLNPHSGEPVSVVPLTWSHAGYVLAVIAYLEKLEELGICETCYPVAK